MKKFVDWAEVRLRWAMAVRVPLIGIAILVLLPLFGRGSSMLSNLFVLEPGWDVALVAWVGFLTTTLCWTCALLVFEYGPDRLGLTKLRLAEQDFLDPKKLFAGSVLLMVPSIPFLWVVRGAMEPRPSWVAFLLPVFGGYVFLLFVLFAAKWLRKTVLTRIPLPRIGGSLPRALQAGYFDVQSGRLHAGHVTAITLFVVLLAVYACVWWFSHPVNRPYAMAPAIAFVLALVMLLVSLLTGASFFFDRFRLPVVVVAIAASWIVAELKDNDHFFSVWAKDRAGAPITARPAPVHAPLRGLASDGASRPPVVVVCASGGGIWAAAWTAQVLTGLQAELPDFVRHVRFMSTVSGGSAGAMHFLERYAGVDGPPLSQAECIRHLAARSSLSASTWGIVYPDFLRAVLPFSIESLKHMDRGWVLEEAWKHPLDEDGCEDAGPVRSRWSEWTARTAAGELPGIVFNATLVDTGERLLFSTVEIPDARQAISFLDQPGFQRDVGVATAARMSATFPYVTPVATPRTMDGDPEHDPVAHVADGGYFDNFGVFSAVEWVWALAQSNALDGLGPVVFLEIRAFPETMGHLETCSTRAERGGWHYETLGPLEVMLSARNSTQIARNDREIELLREALGHERVAEPIVVRPALEVPDGAGCWCEQGGLPLSWHLSPDQQESVRRKWEHVGPQAVTAVRGALDG